MSRWDESNRSSSPFGAWLPACPVIDNRVVHTAIHRFKRPDRRGKKTACQVIAWVVSADQIYRKKPTVGTASYRCQTAGGLSRVLSDLLPLRNQVMCTGGKEQDMGPCTNGLLEGVDHARHTSEKGSDMHGDHPLYRQCRFVVVDVSPDRQVRDIAVEYPAHLTAQLWGGGQCHACLKRRLFNNDVQQVADDVGDVGGCHFHLGKRCVEKQPQPATREDGVVVLAIKLAQPLFERHAAITQLHEPDGLERASDVGFVHRIDECGLVGKRAVEQPL